MLDILLIAILALVVGANDAANVFGSAIGSKMLKFRIAIIFFIIFIILGAIINAKYPSGVYQNLLINYPSLSDIYLIILPVILVTLISLTFKTPSSISQSIIFSILGFSIAKGLSIDQDLFTKLIYFWIATPILAIFLSILFCYLINAIIGLLNLNVFQVDYQIRLSLIIFGCLAAYALGSNLTASIVGVYSPFLSFNIDFQGYQILVDDKNLYFFGSLFIGLGALILSQKILQSVGSQISKITPISALSILLTQIVILLSFSSGSLINKINLILPFEIFAMPLSASHITFASIVGVASFNKFREIKPTYTFKIIISWFTIPLFVALFSYLISSKF